MCAAVSYSLLKSTRAIRSDGALIAPVQDDDGERIKRLIRASEKSMRKNAESAF